jgi:hypothetical protein
MRQSSLFSDVVLGASMSGLLAVRALSGHFERMTVVERDVLPGGDAVRKGVPQAAHVHGSLASGYRAMKAHLAGRSPGSSRGRRRAAGVPGTGIAIAYRQCLFPKRAKRSVRVRR